MMFQDDLKITSIHQATSLRNSLINIYRSAKSVQTLLTRYASGEDPTFNAVIDALYSEDEKAHLGSMLESANQMVADWETNHRSAIGLEPEEEEPQS